MKVLLDKDRCTGHAQCYAAGPDVFDLDDLGYCLLTGDTEQDVPDGLEGQARAGVDACPERALSVVDG